MECTFAAMFSAHSFLIFLIQPCMGRGTVNGRHEEAFVVIWVLVRVRAADASDLTANERVCGLCNE